jgi:DNA-binding NarL/FixJ family response regulator|tara:strand:+ start:83138 stop:83767 length:630 start_codon:yes stop_codon:yes gene_type:complete
MKPSIIIADDHPLLLRGLWDFLLEKGYNLLGKASDGKDALALIEKYAPDIALLDIQMPELSGIEVAQICKQKKIPTRIVLITLHKGKELFEEASKLNLYGYLLKDYALAEIVTCLEHVQNNKQYFSPKLNAHLSEGTPLQKQLQELTPSERKILKRISTGMTNQELADALFLSIRTIEKHRSNIIQKLGLDSKTNSLLVWAQQHKDEFL